MSPERLRRSLRYWPALVGAALMLVGAYAAGGVEATCTRADGRVDCRIDTRRWFGLVAADQQTAADVVDTYVRTSTTSASTRGPSGSRNTRTTSNNTVVLQTRSGAEVDAFGATTQESFADTDRIEEFMRDKSRGLLFLSSSDWPFGLFAFGLGVVCTLATVLIAGWINREA